MARSQINLLTTRRFLPLFLTQFMGACNDNIYKNALVILITYKFAEIYHFNAEILITVAAGIFILPFFIFSALAGQLADKFEKSRIIRYTKWIEVLLMMVAIAGFYFQSVYLLMSVLFLLGMQAAFFGPLKYSILPDHLKTEAELLFGNALIEAGTFIAILLGTIIGGVLVLFHAGEFWVSIVVLLVAMLGLCSSFWIPKAGPAAPGLIINFGWLHETWKIVNYSRKNKEVFAAIIGISWFWLIGATYLSQFPTYVKIILHAQSSVVTLFLTLFSVGVGVGSLLGNILLKGKIHARNVWWAALGISIFGIDLVIATNHGTSSAAGLTTLQEFLSYGANWRIVIDLLGVAISGGIYILPLYAIMQQRSEAAWRSRVIACNNILNALFMVISAIGISLMLAMHFTVSHVFLTVALVNLIMVVASFKFSR